LTDHNTTLPQPGQIVRIRQRTYLAEQVTPRSRAGEDNHVRLTCIDDDAQGQPLEVLWEHEIDAQILTSEAWESIASRGFDPAKLFAAYLHTLRWNCVTATDPKLLQSPFRAGIRLDIYQLEPLRKALLLPRVNLFIADDVGLGKTIEAGLIARELLLRKKVREILVCCPPSMLLQWQDELEARFGLTFQILDRAYLTRIRRERGFGVNPWTTHTRFLFSHSLLIDEGYTGPMLDWLGDFRSGTLLILDEAHHAAPSSGQKYAIDSQITRAVREIAPRFEHRLFLSATPHNGHSNSFSALLEILDPQRFCRGVPATKKALEHVMVRRLKDDIRALEGGFPVREVVQVDISGLPADAPELRLSSLLDEYRGLREQRLQNEAKQKRAAAGLLIINLQQRLLSSIEAFARTLRVHRQTVLKHWNASQAGQPAATVELSQLDLLSGGIGADDARALLPDEELELEEDAQVETVSASTMGPLEDSAAATLFAREQQLLEEMSTVTEAARGRPDARVRKLIDWIRANMCPGMRTASGQRQTDGDWNGTRLLIFTEYADTKRYLFQQLSAAIAGTDRADDRIAVFDGPTPAERREEIKRAFNTDPARHPVRILIATDAAREGLNLQAHCANLFHFDVPWNPSRLEQRNGRIDRKLQPADKVYCHYFVYLQRPEDRVLRALVRKTETIKVELGSLAQVIDAQLEKTLKRGIRRGEVDSLLGEIDAADQAVENRKTVEDELEAVRERQDALTAQIDVLRKQLAASQETIGFDQSHFRSAISCALELAGAEPLTPKPGASDLPSFEFPAIDQRAGGDPTWADTLDTLRAPRPRDMKLWEWRKNSPIRPVVFADTGDVEGRSVHLHLEHRVVQRLLARFSAQGFVHHDLSRACLSQTTDATPRVILLGRLSLYGRDAARLHEEIVPVTARWTETSLRKGPLTPYARDAESKTLGLLEEALAGIAARPIPEVVARKLQASAPQDIHDLLAHLEERGNEYAEVARQKLAKRAEAEASAMQDILTTQRKRIAETAAKFNTDDPKQLKLIDIGDEGERRQLQSNRRHWTKRLAAIEGELQSEPDRIRDAYEVKAMRIEPVGLVYLWPVSG
jgi:superfamily II DNA or RNA helicase